MSNTRHVYRGVFGIAAFIAHMFLACYSRGNSCFFSRYRLTNDTDQLQNVRSSFRFSSWLRVISQSRNFGLKI